MQQDSWNGIALTQYASFTHVEVYFSYSTKRFTA